MHSIRDPKTGLVRHGPFEILGVWRSYYSNLFMAQDCDPVAQDEMLSQLHRRLRTAERAGCEGNLTLDECFEALKGMPKGKTLGSDGFPMEFYQTLWQTLGADLVRVLNAAFEAGQLSFFTRRTINWTPRIGARLVS